MNDQVFAGPGCHTERSGRLREDKDYIRADKWDKWVAVALGIAVLIVVALDSAWLMGWLK